jgi:hypothetical protein
MKNFIVKLIAGMGLLGLLAQTANAQWVPTGSRGDAKIDVLVANGNDIYAVADSGKIYRSTNNYQYWSMLQKIPTNSTMFGIAVLDSTIFAATGGGIFRSTNSGASWTAVDSGLVNLNVQSLAINGGNIFAGTPIGVFLSTNNGTSWSAVATVDSGLINIVSIAVSGSNIFAGTFSNGIYLSTNNGASWIAVNSGLSNLSITRLIVNGSTLFAGTRNGGIFRSTNNGTSWTAVDSGFVGNSFFIFSFAVSGGNIYVATDSGVYLSANNGTIWSAINGIGQPYTIAASGKTIYASPYQQGVFMSTNNGASWTADNVGLPSVVNLYNIVGNITAMVATGGNIFAGTHSGVFLSADNGRDWTSVLSADVASLVAGGSNIFAGTSSGVYLSSNNGTSWIPVDSGITDSSISCLAVKGNNIFAGTHSGEVFLSTNNGTNWKNFNTGIQGAYINCLAASGSNMVAGSGNNIYLSTNNGANWTVFSDDNEGARAFVVSSTNIFAGGFGGEVFLSTNSGASWTLCNASEPLYNLLSLAEEGSYLFAGTYNGVFHSINNGASWAADSGLPNDEITCFSVNGTDLFAGTYGNGIWYRPLPQIGVLHQESPRAVQSNFKVLSQGFFSPITTIEFTLPHSDKVTITVFNLYGHKVASLFNQNIGQGTHSLSWNTSNLAAGCYTVKLQEGANSYAKSVPIFR